MANKAAQLQIDALMDSAQFVITSFDFHIRHILSLIPLCLLFLEYVNTCRFEFSHMWGRPFALSKTLYIISRYFEIAGKMSHYFLIHLIIGRSTFGITSQKCATWYLLMFSDSVTMALILDAVLFLRGLLTWKRCLVGQAVYALYRKSSLVFLLLVPLIIPYGVAAYTAHDTWVHRQQLFDGVCDIIIHQPILTLVVGVSFVISHVIVWICGYARRNVGYGRVPVVRLVVREGTWVFIVLFAISAALTPTSIAVKTTNPFLSFVEGAQGSTASDVQDFRLTTFIHTEIDVTGEE
ncbi:hypothetical protein BJ165DRAFT_1408172 [Panaeolus papilionaceus]|nr:hypothetical protein BJ165DRAFT_1408172 [Panaeolus papilionaceus]